MIAYEVQCRLCDAASLRKHGFDHVTYGAISAAVAACKLLGLDPERTAHGIGLAGVANTALRQTRSGELSMWKGCACQRGPQRCLRGPPCGRGADGAGADFRRRSRNHEAANRSLRSGAVRRGQGRPFMITATYIKFWPAEYHSQSAIEAALKMRPEIGDPAQIAGIDIHTFDAAVDIIGKDPEKWRPKTRETADHSLPYCTAVALADGEVTDKQFEPERFTEPKLLELVANTRVHRDAGLMPAIPMGFPIA